MAAAVPIVGIPMLLASIFDSGNADKKNEQYVERFDQIFMNYMNQWDAVAEHGRDLFNKQLNYFAPKLTQMYLSAFGNLLKDLGSHGYPIYQAQNYFWEEGT